LEIIEASYPLRFERYGFVPDTGGAGESRGGLSIIREVQLLRGEAILQVRSDRRRFMPWGLQGGRDGTPSWNYLNRSAGSEALPSKVTMSMKAGDVYCHITGGGGGYGPPFARSPELVAEDVRDDKLSRAYAEREYGVVLPPDGFA